MDLATLELLAVNEMTMAKSREDKHWGAAWAYHDVAQRMGLGDSVAEAIWEMTKKKGI